ncbi:type II secretion system F family protein [bacterium]|nr:type II secretion system F family protein [bacterium]
MPAREKKYKVSLHHLASFARQFVTMLNGGVPILRALEFYSEGDPSDLGEIISQVCNNVNSGMSLHASFSKYPKVFTPVFLGLVKSGEKTGELTKMLSRLATLLEQEDHLMSRIRSAVTYPFFLALVSFTVGCIFMYVIIPAIEPLLTGLGVEPPWPTKVLILLGKIIRHPATLIGVPSLLVLTWFLGPTVLENARKHPVWGERLDWLPMNIPIVSDLYQRITLARILYSMATTLDSGLNILNALDLGASVTDNRYFQRALQKSRMALTDGENLEEALLAAQVFPAAMVQMLTIGEETASLSTVMGNVSNMYAEDATYRMDTAVQLMEPIMLFTMGIVSAFLVLAAILPLVKMIDSL